jgi:hypothetical protein
MSLLSLSLSLSLDDSSGQSQCTKNEKTISISLHGSRLHKTSYCIVEMLHLSFTVSGADIDDHTADTAVVWVMQEDLHDKKWGEWRNRHKWVSDGDIRKVLIASVAEDTFLFWRKRSHTLDKRRSDGTHVSLRLGLDSISFVLFLRFRRNEKDVYLLLHLLRQENVFLEK